LLLLWLPSDGWMDGWMGGETYVMIKTQLDLCQRPSRHRPQRVLPQPLLTYAGPMPNFKKNIKISFSILGLFEFPHANKNRGNS
jgi:hypothetical protein